MLKNIENKIVEYGVILDNYYGYDVLMEKTKNLHIFVGDKDEYDQHIYIKPFQYIFHNNKSKRNQ
jgi:hypothetical protein